MGQSVNECSLFQVHLMMLVGIHISHQQEGIISDEEVAVKLPKIMMHCNCQGFCVKLLILSYIDLVVVCANLEFHVFP